MTRQPLALAILTVACAADLPAGVPTCVAGGKPNRDAYVAGWGVRAADFAHDFRGDGQIQVCQAGTSVSCNMAYPGDAASVDVQVRNVGAAAVAFEGRFVLMPFTFVTRSDDVFDLGVTGGETIPVAVRAFDLAPRACADVTLDLPLPERFGTYALFLERADTGTRLFVASFARLIRASLEPGQAEYRVCMDQDDPAVIARLRTPSNRLAVPFIPSYEPSAEKRYAQIAEQLKKIGETGYPICVEFGAGPERGKYLPLGRTRPHLSADNVMLETKSDYVWLPEYDAEFAARVKWIVKNFGYPKGPVNALMLWNEPWAGISISGWGADDLRYREIYETMCRAAEEAMAETPGVKVLLGGTDSSSNTFDKLFGDGDLKFLKWMDFMSIHYQGLAPSNPRYMRDREHPNGRTRFWDTESWVANTPDRVPAVLAAMFAAGHDRLVGIQGNAVVASPLGSLLRRKDGKEARRSFFQAWPAAPALAAFQDFVGNRDFVGVAWKGLPWIYEFQGKDAEDFVCIVCGDIGPAIDGRARIGEVPFWTVRGNGEKTDGTLTLADGKGLSLYDACGNRLVRGTAGEPLTIKLDDNGVYLRADRAAGSAARLRAQLAAARLTGLPQVVPALRDAIRPVGAGAVFAAELFNPLNRAVAGTLVVEMPGLTLAYEKDVALKPQETLRVPLTVTAGAARADNTYPCRLVFTPAEGRPQVLMEKLHVNTIAARTPVIDGKIGADWEGVLPQTVETGAGGATMMEKAWLPMLALDEAVKTKGAVKAEVYLAADDTAFHFAARVRDATPDAGMKRFETRNEEDDFYPDEVVEYDAKKTVSTLFRNGAWTCRVNKMAFEIDAEGTCALEFTDDDQLYRRTLRIAVNGKPTVFRPCLPKSRFEFTATGKTRVEIETLNWLKPQLVAIELNGARLAAAETGDARIRWTENVEKIVHVWPKGVRHYSYRQRPELPCGQKHDNVQIAFNVLDDDAKPWYPSAPGMFKGYSGYWCSDYDLSLNPVAPAFGGGTEIWKNRAPGMPDKHFFPHAVKSPLEGPVKDGRLVVTRDGDTLVYEASIPWPEIPEVKAARDAGRTVKFSCRVNDNASGAIAELAYRRSVSKRNLSFKPDWSEHWANELAFSFER